MYNDTNFIVYADVCGSPFTDLLGRYRFILYYQVYSFYFVLGSIPFLNMPAAAIQRYDNTTDTGELNVQSQPVTLPGQHWNGKYLCYDNSERVHRN